VSQNMCFSIALLDGRFHGRADGDQPEWPPSPWRLFQALLAGAHTGSRHVEWTDAHANAFRWLERRAPPLIIAPEPLRLNMYAISVPNNDLDMLAREWAKGKEHRRTPAELRTLKSVRPTASAKGQPLTLHFVYPLTEPEAGDPATRGVAETLCQVAGCLHTFGWGIDAAVACGRILGDEQAQELTGVRWRPEGCPSLPQNLRRVPKEGALDDLAHCHEQFTQRLAEGTVRPPDRPSAFARVAYLPETAVPARPFAAFLLRDCGDPDSWRPFRQQEANAVAAMLRSLACRAAQADTHAFPNGSDVYVAGHTNGDPATPPRFSYLVLPTIGHPNADGMIRRVLVAESHGGDGTHAAWVASRLRGRTLTDSAGQPAAILESSGPKESVIRRYLAPSKTWTTVTPVILPGHDEFKPPKAGEDAKITKAERLLLKTLAQAGIPPAAVADLALRKAPFWPGGLHPRDYQRPDYLKNLPAWHVSLTFREPVSGPLALGAGRHCGLGLLAAEPEDSP